MSGIAQPRQPMDVALDGAQVALTPIPGWTHTTSCVHPVFDVEDLYRLHYRSVRAYFISALRNIHDAEDAAHDVFARVVRSHGTYRPDRGPARAWLFAIARNEALRRLGSRRPFHSLPPEAIAELLEITEATAPRRMGMVDDGFVALIGWLPQAQRDVIVLRYMLDFSTAEIAIALERTQDAVRQLQSRALRSLFARLEKTARHPVSVARHPMRRLRGCSLVGLRRRLCLLMPS